MGYLKNGRLLARGLFLHEFSAGYGGRSFLYCLGILPFHWNRNPWPVVALNALLTAWILWLVVRSMVAKRTLLSFLVLIALLAGFTSLSWFVSLIMPDILGPLLYLCMYLLVFARDSLSTIERTFIALIAWWSVASHASHLILAAVLCIVLAAVLLLERRRSWSRLQTIGEVAFIIAMAAAAQLALNTYLYGRPSLNGKRPPFLMARVIVDGPGRWYLEHHCAQEQFAICDYRRKIHAGISDDEFLWDADGVWKSASPAEQDRLRAQETRFVVAAVRAYPREQLAISAANFREQLMTFGLWDYGPNPYMAEVIDQVLPGGRARYLQSRQARRDLPDEFSSAAQGWTVLISILLIGVVAAFCRRRLSPRLLGLCAVIVSVVVANALVTGVLSNVEDRYQSRVVWLLPLLAGMFVLDCLASVGESESTRQVAGKMA